MSSKKHRLTREEWKEFCAEMDVDPYENCELGFDLGGGDSETYYCYDEPPEEK